MGENMDTRIICAHKLTLRHITIMARNSILTDFKNATLG